MANEESFERDAYRFLPFFTRREDQDKGGSLLRRIFGAVNSVWDQVADKIEEIRTLPDPTQAPVETLKHRMSLVGFGGPFSHVWSALGEEDLRRLLFAAVPLWRASGTVAAIKIAARLLTGKPILVRDSHSFLPVFTQSPGITFGVKYRPRYDEGESFWLVGPSTSSPHDIDSIDLHLIDEGLNRTLLTDLLGAIRSGGEKIVIVYADFVEDWEGTELRPWWGYSSGDVTVEDRSLLLGPGDGGDPDMVALTEISTLPFGDFYFSTSFLVENPSAVEDSSFTVFFRVDLDVFGPDPTGYALFTLCGSGPSAVNRFWRLIRFENGQPPALLATGTLDWLGPNQEYHLGITCREEGVGTRIRITIDGVVIDEVDDAYSGRPLEGSFVLMNIEADASQTVRVGTTEVLRYPGDVGLVGPVLQVHPTRYSLTSGQSVTLRARGGSGSYGWDFDENNSGGTVTPLDEDEAEYTAGTVVSTVVDLVRLEDNFGNTTVAEITVEP